MNWHLQGIVKFGMSQLFVSNTHVLNAGESIFFRHASAK